MASNFLGDVGGYSHRASSILSAAELIAREGVNLQKGMNYRPPARSGGGGELPSVFLVLSHEGTFFDEWNEETELYMYQGHDSITVEGGKLRDQIAMYSDGRVTDNGKFLKAANAFKDGMRKEPLQVQIYEKLDPGVWFDKGIFNLVDAKQTKDSGRNVFKFYLNPAGSREAGAQSEDDYAERMLSAATKEKIWLREKGRCAVCGVQAGLHFAAAKKGAEMQLLCENHAGREKRGLLG